MTIDATSVLSISIGAILAVIGAAIVLTATWTRVTMRLDAIATQLKELRTWHLRHTESASAELDDAVESMRSRQHHIVSRMQNFEIRLDRVERKSGITHAIVDHATGPIDVDPPRARRAVTLRPEESGT